jgi:hypothetical protein
MHMHVQPYRPCIYVQASKEAVAMHLHAEIKVDRFSLLRGDVADADGPLLVRVQVLDAEAL